MLNFLGRKAGGRSRTAVVADADGVAVAQADGGASCRFHALPADGDAAQLLQRVAREQSLGKGDCTTVMDLGSYQLLLVEAPEVPPAELRAAVRWRIKDLIDFHVDDAVLDVFDVPASSARGTQHQLYVVVARASALQQQADRLQDAGINLTVIDIPELVLRNLAARLPEDEGGLAVLYFGAEQGLITLNRKATLYLSRTLDLGYRLLGEAAAGGPEELERLLEMLALEVQRSADYYDRHFQQAAIGAVAVMPLPVEVPGLTDALHRLLGIPVRMVEPAELVGGESDAPPAEVARCLLAIGAALRQEPVAL